MNYAVINNYGASRGKCINQDDEEHDEFNAKDSSYINYGLDDGSDQVLPLLSYFNLIIEIR